MRQLPDDWTPPPVGARREIIAAVTGAVPEADPSDPARGQLIGPGWSVELDIGDEDPVDSIMLHVRGSGDDVLDTVFRLSTAPRCGVLDCSRGDPISPGGPTGWYAFREFRDRVIDSSTRWRPAGR